MLSCTCKSNLKVATRCHLDSYTYAVCYLDDLVNTILIFTELTASITVDPEGNRAMLTGDSEYSVMAKPGVDNCQEQVVAVMVSPSSQFSKSHFNSRDIRTTLENFCDQPNFGRLKKKKNHKKK